MHKHATHKLLQATHTIHTKANVFAFLFFIKKIKSVSVLCKAQSSPAAAQGDGLLTAGTALTDTHGSIYDDTTASK